MKYSAIKDIFYGRRGDQQALGVPEKNQENLEKICDAYNALKEKFTPEQLKIHNDFVDLINYSNCDTADFYFVEGFKLGLLIGIECMEDSTKSNA